MYQARNGPLPARLKILLHCRKFLRLKPQDFNCVLDPSLFERCKKMQFFKDMEYKER